jgi:hypothetical protein
MKTETNGYFYAPTPKGYLRIEELFSNSLITGDQTGNSTPPYSSIPNWPDGTVDGKDLTLVTGHLGQTRGEAKWNYMADVGAYGFVDGRDITIVAKNFGQSGTYSEDLSNVTVTFNTGQYGTPTVIDGLNGFVYIPQGVSSFTITEKGSTIGALITFWTFG